MKKPEAPQGDFSRKDFLNAAALAVAIPPISRLASSIEAPDEFTYSQAEKEEVHEVAQALKDHLQIPPTKARLSFFFGPHALNPEHLSVFTGKQIPNEYEAEVWGKITEHGYDTVCGEIALSTQSVKALEEWEAERGDTQVTLHNLTNPSGMYNVDTSSTHASTLRELLNDSRDVYCLDTRHQLPTHSKSLDAIWTDQNLFNKLQKITLIGSLANAAVNLSPFLKNKEKNRKADANLLNDKEKAALTTAVLLGLGGVGYTVQRAINPTLKKLAPATSFGNQYARIFGGGSARKPAPSESLDVEGLSYSAEEFSRHIRDRIMALNLWSLLSKQEYSENHFQSIAFTAGDGHLAVRRLFLEGPDKAQGDLTEIIDFVLSLPLALAEDQSIPTAEEIALFGAYFRTFSDGISQIEHGVGEELTIVEEGRSCGGATIIPDTAELFAKMLEDVINDNSIAQNKRDYLREIYLHIN